MSVIIKTLINSKYAANSNTTEYTTPANTRTIVDKFTATNTDAGALTLTVHLVPSGETLGSQHTIIKEVSIAAGATEDISKLQNQILSAGDFISVVASSASKMVIRSSGREVST